MNYYIKKISGPRAFDYSENKIIHFSNSSSRDKFLDCNGFLLYETEGEEAQKGEKTIYAWGIIDRNQKDIVINDPNEFQFGVRVDIKNRVKTELGISIGRLKELEIEIRRSWGGLLDISERQFEILKKELVKISNE